jgi:hypothetical protein
MSRVIQVLGVSAEFGGGPRAVQVFRFRQWAVARERSPWKAGQDLTTLLNRCGAELRALISSAFTERPNLDVFRNGQLPGGQTRRLHWCVAVRARRTPHLARQRNQRRTSRLGGAR